MTGPAEEAKVLEEVLKLVKLGAVREVNHEPYVIPAFGVPKKMAQHDLCWTLGNLTPASNTNHSFQSIVRCL